MVELYKEKTVLETMKGRMEEEERGRRVLSVLETMKGRMEEEERGRRVPIPIPSIHLGLTLAQYSKS